MLETIAILLPVLTAFGVITARGRRSSEKCRRYLATIERWQPRGLVDGAVPVAQAHAGVGNDLASAMIHP